MKRVFLLSSTLLASCSFSPVEQPPPIAAAMTFKEGPVNWKTAEPSAAEPRGDWWRIFHDGELDALMRAVEDANQSLEASIARADQANAVLAATKLAFIPTLGGNLSITKSKSGAFGGSSYGTATGASGAGTGTRDIQSFALNSNWELDLWGRLRHQARAAHADFEAAIEDTEALRLSLQANAARTYFLLRAAEAEEQSLRREAASLTTSLQLTRNREAQGIASKSDVALAETQLASTQAAMQEAILRRATLFHALAVLAGRTPADFRLPAGKLESRVPSPPPALPSTLLERRPDVAAAERRVAAANERIGAARAAFFPVLSLSADTGWRALADGGFAALFSSANNFWALGANAAFSVLDSGRRIAARNQTEAIWRETVAAYRQAVLTGFQETEDALANLRILAAEALHQTEAVRASRESVRIATNQYEAGTLNYLNVVVAQTAALNSERAAIDVQARRLNAVVNLVTALGGCW